MIPRVVGRLPAKKGFLFFRGGGVVGEGVGVMGSIPWLAQEENQLALRLVPVHCVQTLHSRQRAENCMLYPQIQGDLSSIRKFF